MRNERTTIRIFPIFAPSKPSDPMNQQTAATESPTPITLALCIIVQWTWGIVQNVLGFLLFLTVLRKRHYLFRTSLVTEWKFPYSASYGMFVFLNREEDTSDPKKVLHKWEYDMLVHEYGHSIQSMLLGPLFLPVIAIPSVIWATAPFFEKLRNRKKLSYHWLYCEKWANAMGDRVCQNRRFHN